MTVRVGRRVVAARALRQPVAWLALLWLALITVAQAEVGDALGAGLTPPTAVRYADPAWYDLLDARWGVDDRGAPALELELAAIDPGAPLLQPIVEAYLMRPEALGRGSLPGTGLVAPDDAGWDVAVRVTSDGAWAWTAGLEDPLRARRLASEVVGRTVRVQWPADLPVVGSWVAISGTSRILASRLPTLVFPEPGAPIMTTIAPPSLSIGSPRCLQCVRDGRYIRLEVSFGFAKRITPEFFKN